MSVEKGPEGKCLGWKLSGGEWRIRPGECSNPMQDYRRTAVMICAAVVNRQTHRQVAFTT